MKKLIMAAAIVCAAVAANAAAIGWSNAGLSTYKGDKYLMFVYGQNGVTDLATVTALLDQGKPADSYAIGGGTVAANGMATQASATSGVTFEAGTYTAFMVLFNAATPVKGESKYTVLEGGNGGTGYTITFSSQAANANFIGGNASTMIDTWNNYGEKEDPEPTPEPTSGLLMLIGMAGLALRRKQK